MIILTVLMLAYPWFYLAQNCQLPQWLALKLDALASALFEIVTFLVLSFLFYGVLSLR